MKDILQCYKTLGIEPGCSPERVRNAYVQLYRFYDPVRYMGEPEHLSRAEDMRKKIAEAYQELRRFLPDLQGDTDRLDKAMEQDRDFNELARQTPTERSKAILGILAALVLAGILAFGSWLYIKGQAIPAPEPVDVPFE